MIEQTFATAAEMKASCTETLVSNGLANRDIG